MPTGAAIASGIAGVGGAIVQSNAANKAGDKAVAAARDSNNVQKQMLEKILAQQNRFFNITREGFHPYMKQGKVGLNALTRMVRGGDNDLVTQFLESGDTSILPGFDFILQQGLEAAQNGFASRGLGSSGVAIEGGVKFAEDLANTYWKDLVGTNIADQSFDFDRALALAQLGQSSAAGVGSSAAATGRTMAGATQNAANSIGDSIIGAGNAQAGAAASQGAAWGNAFGNIGDIGLLKAIGAF